MEYTIIGAGVAIYFILHYNVAMAISGCWDDPEWIDRMCGGVMVGCLCVPSAEAILILTCCGIFQLFVNVPEAWNVLMGIIVVTCTVGLMYFTPRLFRQIKKYLNDRQVLLMYAKSQLPADPAYAGSRGKVITVTDPFTSKHEISYVDNFIQEN